MEAEEFGCKSVLTFLEVYCATKSVANLTQLKNWASWYILESVAYWIRDQEANK
jgi:hypothetical protein